MEAPEQKLEVMDMNNITLVVIIMIFNTFIGSLGSLFLKKGAKKFHINIKVGLFTLIKDILTNWNIILGVLLYFISSILFLYLLKTEELSMLYPMTSLSYIFVTVLSVYVLREKINIYKIGGIAFIILGVVLVTL